MQKLHGNQDTEIRWKFPASDRVLGMIAQLNNATWNNGSHFTINSAKPIHPEQFLDVFTHLYRQMEVLRMCFRQRGDELWIGEMPEPVIDFKVVPWNNVHDEVRDLMLEPYNLNDGPLWRARLMPCPEDAPCNHPLIKNSFPHQYNLIMCFHHAMIDGVTSFIVTGAIFKLLEDLLAGRPLEDEELGIVIGDSYLVELEDKIRRDLESDPGKLKALLEQHSAFKTPILVEAFGSPVVEHPITEAVPPYIIDKEVLRTLQRKCHSRGVTLNSGLMGIFTTALVELVREEGLIRDVYAVSTKHPVNLRRYMFGPKTTYHGYYSTPMSHSMTVPGDVRKHFWKYVGKFDVEFRGKLERNYACEERVLDAMLRPPGYTHEGHFSRVLPVKYDFSFSNVYAGKITPFGMGENIQVTDYLGHTQVTNCEFGMLLAVAGFRDDVSAQVAYSTGRLASETVRRYSEKAKSVLYEISRSLD